MNSSCLKSGFDPPIRHLKMMYKSHGAFKYLLKFLLRLSMITNYIHWALIFCKFLLFCLFIKLKEIYILLICSEDRKNVIQSTPICDMSDLANPWVKIT